RRARLPAARRRRLDRPRTGAQGLPGEVAGDRARPRIHRALPDVERHAVAAPRPEGAQPVDADRVAGPRPPLLSRFARSGGEYDLRVPTAVALVPARAGSERVPGKNVHPLAGHPLIAYTIAAALQSGVFASVLVSTDSSEIAAIAGHYGAELP